jgi:hypothetical protein
MSRAACSIPILGRTGDDPSTKSPNRSENTYRVFWRADGRPRTTRSETGLPGANRADHAVGQ